MCVWQCCGSICSVQGSPQDIGGFIRRCLPACRDTIATDMWTRWILSFSMTSKTSMVPKVVVDICICRSLPLRSRTHIKVKRKARQYQPHKRGIPLVERKIVSLSEQNRSGTDGASDLFVMKPCHGGVAAVRLTDARHDFSASELEMPSNERFDLREYNWLSS